MTISSVPESSEIITAKSSSTVLRHYSSPTCQLEISANPSPLEKWTRKPTLKNQRFLLKFEDPRLSEDQWISLRGDRLKLAALTEAVTTYVQTFLSQSLTLVQPSQSSQTLAGTLIAELPTLTTPAPQGISLEPHGLLAHILNLGTIATESTGDSLKLTSTQLADLASVLEEHASSTLDFPALNRDTAWMRSPANWGKIAALSLLSVGITASVLNQFSPQKDSTEIASQASSRDQRLPPSQLPTPSPTIPSILVSPGSSLPTGQLPSLGTASVPIAAPSPIASTTNPSASSTSTQIASTGPRQLQIPVRNPPAQQSETAGNPSAALGNTAPESTNSKESRETRELGKLPSATVQGIPVPAISAPQPMLAKKAGAPEAPDSEPPPLDLTSQIAGIQAKIPQKWTPPDKFSGELKYLLEIAPNGTLRTINPEGPPQAEAQDLLPKVGSEIAPPLSSGTSPYKVRVFFFSDGSVSVMQANGI